MRHPRLSGADQDHQRATVVVDQGMNLGGQTTPGAPDRMVSRFVIQALELGPYDQQTAVG